MLRASLIHRDRYRRALDVAPHQRLVVVSSTWGPGALLARRPDLMAELLRDLPYDQYVVAAVLHANIWTAHGPWQVRSWLRRASEGGLRLIPHRAGWKAALAAADCLIGDNGSVTFYGAALGVPTLLGAFDDGDVSAGSSMERFGRSAPRWRDGLSPSVQLGAAGELDDSRYADLVENSFAMVGRSLEEYRRVVYGLLAFEAPARMVRSLADAEPRPLREAVLAHVVTCRPTLRGPAHLRMHRRPAALDPVVDDGQDAHIAVVDTSADTRMLESAAVVQTTMPGTAPALFDRLPAAAVVVLRIGDDAFVVTTRSCEFTVKSDTDIDALAVGSAIYVAAVVRDAHPEAISVDFGPVTAAITLAETTAV